MEQIRIFFEKVKGDEVLQGQLKALAEEKQGAELLQATCEVGAEQGCLFSVDELAQLQQLVVQSGGELDDAILEQVNAAGYAFGLGVIWHYLADYFLHKP